MSYYIKNVSLPSTRLARLKEDYHQQWTDLLDSFEPHKRLANKRRAEEEESCRASRAYQQSEGQTYSRQYNSTSSSRYYGDSTTSRVVYLVGSCSSSVQLVNVTPAYSCNAVSAASTGYSRSDGRSIGITTKGELCKNCLRGYNCPYH